MTEKVAAVITSYNMWERTASLAEYIGTHCSWPCDVIVVDNGSDLAPPYFRTAVRLRENVQVTAGWLMGLAYADHLARKHGPYFAYWILITSTEFVGGDPLTPMCELLMRDPNAVGVHPALTDDSTTSWEHLKARGGEPRQTWMLDNIAALYRADWFDGIGRFDPRYVYAWGPDLETGLIARREGRTLWVHEGCRAKKVTDIAYRMNRMGMTAERRRELAGQNMRAVFAEKYGPGFWQTVTEEGVAEALR
ncbi:MAG: hypothetical protein MUP64_13895 [Anaerolineae bacterium]|nr:hypothetical protein [Anaerolineae bacterium]